MITEDSLGKPYDLKLLRRLGPFLQPYRRLLAGSVLLVVGITLMELALPYFTKIAIDRYIVPTEESAAMPDPGQGGRMRRYVAVDADDPAVQRTIRRYPRLFLKNRGRTQIALEDFGRIAPLDRVVLRRRDLDGLNLVVILYAAVVAINFGFNFVQRMLMEYGGHRVMHDVRVRLYEHVQQQSMAFFTRQPVARLVTRMTNDVQNAIWASLIPMFLYMSVDTMAIATKGKPSAK